MKLNSVGYNLFRFGNIPNLNIRLAISPVAYNQCTSMNTLADGVPFNCPNDRASFIDSARRHRFCDRDVTEYDSRHF